jgi:hypothetical protein
VKRVFHLILLLILGISSFCSGNIEFATEVCSKFSIDLSNVLPEAASHVMKLGLTDVARFIFDRFSHWKNPDEKRFRAFFRNIIGDGLQSKSKSMQQFCADIVCEPEQSRDQSTVPMSLHRAISGGRCSMEIIDSIYKILRPRFKAVMTFRVASCASGNVEIYKFSRRISLNTEAFSLNTEAFPNNLDNLTFGSFEVLQMFIEDFPLMSKGKIAANLFSASQWSILAKFLQAYEVPSQWSPIFVGSPTDSLSRFHFVTASVIHQCIMERSLFTREDFRMSAVAVPECQSWLTSRGYT